MNSGIVRTKGIAKKHTHRLEKHSYALDVLYKQDRCLCNFLMIILLPRYCEILKQMKNC